MYSLVSGFIEHYFRKTDHRALIVGLDGVGKTVRSFRSFNRKWKSAFSARLNILSLNIALHHYSTQTLVNAIKCVANQTPVPTSFKCFQTIGMNGTCS